MNLEEHYKVHYTKGSLDYDETRFGSLRGRLSAENKNRIISNILDRLYQNKNIKILDVASGTGRILLHLLDKGFYNVTASDLTEAMIEKSKSKLKPEHNVKYLICDMRSIPSEDDSYDVATVGSFFYLIPANEYSSFVSDIKRVLKKNGYLICEVSNAFHLINPISFIKVLIYKHMKKKKIKSYIYPWQLNKLFDGFTLTSVYGIEFPSIISKNKNLYDIFSKNFLSKYLGGKFLLVYRVNKS